MGWRDSINRYPNVLYEYNNLFSQFRQQKSGFACSFPFIFPEILRFFPHEIRPIWVGPFGPVSTAIRLRLGPPASGKTQLLRRLAMEAIMAHEGEASSSEVISDETWCQ